MRKLIVFGLVLAIFLSGCPDIQRDIIPGIKDIIPGLKTSEEKAIELAETTTEGKMMSLMSDALDNMQECTVDELITEAEIFAREQGLGELPEMGAEERRQIEQLKNCGVLFERKVHKESEGLYLVSYSPDISPDCPLPSSGTQEDIVVIRVNIDSGTTTVTKGEIPSGQEEQMGRMSRMLEEGGKCRGIAVIMGGSSVSSGRPQPS